MRLLGIISLSLGLVAGVAQAQQITAIAVSPDGTGLLVAGDNRVIYAVDPQTLAVTDRRYEPGRVKWMEFSEDGRTVYVLLEDERFIAFAAGSFKERFQQQKIDAVSYAPAANRIALLESNYDGGILHVLQAANGKQLTRIAFPDIDTELVALSGDGTRALILTDDDKTEDEPKKDTPGDLKDFDKYLFRQQNDGYMSQILSVDLKAETFTAAPTFYKVNYPGQVRMQGDSMVIIKDRDDSAFVPANGKATLLDLGKDFFSAARISDDAQSMLLTSGNDVAIVPLIDGVVGAPLRAFKVDHVSGPSERVTAADEAGDGTLYMGTSAYRLWKLTPDGTNIEVAPVF